MLPDIDDIPFLNEHIKTPPVTPASISSTSDMFLLPAIEPIPGDPVDGLCPPGQWLCADNATCIFDNQKCDGTVDCPISETGGGGEDEDKCESGKGG